MSPSTKKEETNNETTAIIQNVKNQTSRRKNTKICKPMLSTDNMTKIFDMEFI